MRDVEALLEETFGEQVIGKSTIARVCEDARERYGAWCERRLDAHGEPPEGVLVVWGLTLEGQKVLARADRSRPAPIGLARTWPQINIDLRR